jgi:DNA (cytosine-5)-methyltransferase 1
MLVLSLFPGIGLLDRAFEEEGFTVVRGPDVLWGGDVRTFHPPAGRFEGVIGGPPCQPFSRLRHMVEVNGYQPRHANLIPEYERVVAEAQPDWFLMEEVPAAPLPAVEGYAVHSQTLNNRWLGEEQERVRRISFGTRDGRRLHVEPAPLLSPVWEPAVTGHAAPTPVKRHRTGVKSTAGKAPRSIGQLLALQGLPPDYLNECPLTESGKRLVVGNGVPLPMGRAIAQAVQRAMRDEPEDALEAHQEMLAEYLLHHDS